LLLCGNLYLLESSEVIWIGEYVRCLTDVAGQNLRISVRWRVLAPGGMAAADPDRRFTAETLFDPNERISAGGLNLRNQQVFKKKWVAIILRRTVHIIRIRVAVLVAVGLSNLGKMRRVPPIHIFRIEENWHNLARAQHSGHIAQNGFEDLCSTTKSLP
jgi:hypothetical protein